jgi:hypothetical protein
MIETCKRVQVGKQLSDMFPTKKDLILPLLFNFALGTPLGVFRRTMMA